MKLTIDRINNSIYELKDDSILPSDSIILSDDEVEQIYKIYRKRVINPEKVDINELNDILCESFKIDLKTLKSKTRKSEVVLARDIAFFVLYLTNFDSFGKIGEEYSKDHATVMHGNKEIWNIIEYGEKLGDKRYEIVVKILRYFSLWDDENNCIKEEVFIKYKRRNEQ